MSGIRVLAGTRKGAFILTSDAKRKNWKVDGPHFAGWEIYHMKGSPVDPGRISVEGRGRDVAGAIGTAQTRYRPEVAARCRRHVFAHDSSGSKESGTNIRRDLCCRRLS